MGLYFNRRFKNNFNTIFVRINIGWPKNMNVEFTTPLDQKQGTIASLLKQSYADVVKSDPSFWEPEKMNWEQYDQDVFEQPQTVGACIFLTRLDGRTVGFGSWDPRQRPRFGIIGHNCILPEFRGKGLGKRQIQEILRRFREMSIETAKVSTNDQPFFVPAQRVYAACGFREVRRIPWNRDPGQRMIEYEMEIGQQNAPANTAVQRS
jgi:GNAT superfamily N-acetyltransferase